MNNDVKNIFDTIKKDIENIRKDGEYKYIENLKEKNQMNINKENEFKKDFIALLNELSNTPLNKEGYGYKYTSLDVLIDTIKKVAKKHNIGVSQEFTFVENKEVYKTETEIVEKKNIANYIKISTILYHNNGYAKRFDSLYPFDANILGSKNNYIQNIGASITYLRRYSLAIIFGIASEDDTDGYTKDDIKKLESSGVKKGVANKTQSKITDAQKKYITNILNSRNLSLSSLGIKSLDELTQKQASDLIDKLLANKKQ